MPEDAKGKGVYFGLCDAEGNLLPAEKIEYDEASSTYVVTATATHVGWKVAS